MAQFFDARDPGSRIAGAVGFVFLLVAFLGTGAATAGDVQVNLDVLKTLPAAKSGKPSEAIVLTPPKAQRQNIGRREEALRRAREKRLLEQARRKAAAKKRAAATKKAEAARNAEAARKAEAAKKAEKARQDEEARQAAEMERRAEAERKAEAARKAEAKRREAEAAKKAEAAKEAGAAKAAEAAKAAKRREAKAVLAPAKAAAKPKTAAVAAKKQVATRTPRPPLSKARLLFGKESATLSGAAKGKLEPIVAKMISRKDALLVIYAYAASERSNPSDAQRLSLSRALAVRRLVAGKGVPLTRTEIRALGDRVGAGPSDRVDLVVVQR